MQRLRGKGVRLGEVKPTITEWFRGNPSRNGKGLNYRKTVKYTSVRGDSIQCLKAKNKTSQPGQRGRCL